MADADPEADSDSDPDTGTDPDIDPDVVTRALAADSLAAGSPTAWFDRLYDAAGRGEAVVPWDRGAPHPLLVEWLEAHGAEAATRAGAGRRAVVPGFGPGHDAELLAAHGYAVTAFEVSEVAVDQVRERYPDSAVDHVVADLLDLPSSWERSFDLVLEAMTVQSMPRDVRAEATAALRSLVAPGGTLLVVGIAPDDVDAPGPPWPLTEAEMRAFADDRLALVALDRLPPSAPGGLHRWRGEYAASR